jgi:N-formylglutamate amidohydrolase
MAGTSTLDETDASCVVLHIPHASTVIPSDVRHHFQPSGPVIDHDVFRLTDHFTDELFQIESVPVRRLVYSVSRMVCDPERFEDDELEPCSRIGFGVIYTVTTSAEVLRKKPDGVERADLLDRFYRPHHQLLEETVAAAVKRHGRCLILDCHSFPSDPLPFANNSTDPIDYPDICLGTDRFHTPKFLVESCQQLFQSEGFRTAVDIPFSGTIVPLSRYGRDKRVSSLMIEVNRDLYMERLPPLRKVTGFGNVSASLQKVISSIATDFVA